MAAASEGDGKQKKLSKKDLEELKEIEKLKKILEDGIDSKTGKRLTGKQRRRIQKRLEQLEELHHRPRIEIFYPTFIRVFPDNSWGYEGRPYFDPPTDPDPGSGMAQRGLITFQWGVPQGGGGKILLRIDCQAIDMWAPLDIIHMTGSWAGTDVTTGVTGKGAPNPPKAFGGDFGKMINTFPASRLREGLFFFQDGNPAKGMFVILIDGVPVASASQNFTMTATDSGGSDTQSITIHQ